MSGNEEQSKLEVFAFAQEDMRLDEVAAFAQRAEALGFDGVYVPDAVHDGLLLACLALNATKRIKVSISVLVAFPRSPMNVALAAWDLQRLSGGRLELGLGTQIRQNVEDRFSARWLPPAAGMREYVGSLRAIFHSFRTGEPLNFVGEHYKFTRLQSFFNPGPIDAPDVPIMLGAVGPKMLALVGEVADGMHTHPTNTMPAYLRQTLLPHVTEGTSKRSPDLKPPLISTMGLIATGPDDATVEMEWRRCRKMLAFVFSTPAYWISLELIGHKELGTELLAMTKQGRWKEMAAAVPDDVLEAFVVRSLYDKLPEALASRYSGLTNRISMIVPENPAHDPAAAVAISEIRAHWPNSYPFVAASS